MSYAYAPSSTTESIAQVFYARQVSCPILVTVYHMLECYDMNIMPYPDFDRRAGSRQDGESQDENLESGKGWCLFSIEVRNTYGLPFEVTFERTDKGEKQYTIHPYCL
jgi:trafficking protein particle complex subunit 9